MCSVIVHVCVLQRPQSPPSCPRPGAAGCWLLVVVAAGCWAQVGGAGLAGAGDGLSWKLLEAFPPARPRRPCSHQRLASLLTVGATAGSSGRMALARAPSGGFFSKRRVCCVRNTRPMVGQGPAKRIRERDGGPRPMGDPTLGPSGRLATALRRRGRTDGQACRGAVRGARRALAAGSPECSRRPGALVRICSGDDSNCL